MARTLPFRSIIFISILVLSLIILNITGFLIYLVRLNTIGNATIATAEIKVRGISGGTEENLAVVEQTLRLLTGAGSRMDRADFGALMDATIGEQSIIRAIYFIDGDGKTLAVGVSPGNRSSLDPDLLGIDFSYSPLYNSLVEENRIIWSDKFISTLSGDISIGAALRVGTYTGIAELSLPGLLETLLSQVSGTERLWVVDRRGEIVADTGSMSYAGIYNGGTIPFMKDAMSDIPLEKSVRFENHYYHIRYDRSRKLGWLFLYASPAGRENPLIQNLITDLSLLSVSFFMASLIIAPFLSRRITMGMDHLKRQADLIAEGGVPEKSIPSSIREIGDLSRNVYAMYEKIREREGELKKLNQELESRVDERTGELKRSNGELRKTLDDLNNMQDVLIQSEKLAALGRLVAGVAHELNTPVGNALLSLSSLGDRFSHFKTEVDRGLRKSELDDFLLHTGEGIAIADRNIQRAAELITSFKHVASDQTSSVRRNFDLSQLVRDTLMTLHPMIRKTPHRVENRIDSPIPMDSYPGPLGQILTNIITNAFLHAWEGDRAGTLVIEGTVEGERVTLTLGDDGAGIPAEFGRRIFDPFFTSKMGKGGTGLGLNIAYNSAKNILGGTLDYSSREGEGSLFILTIPLRAPVLGN